MTEPETPKPGPKPGVARARLPFEERPRASLGDAIRRAQPMLYIVVVIALIGVAFYMGEVRHMPFLSAYVIAPIIGAAWFGLRVFMLLTPRDK